MDIMTALQQKAKERHPGQQITPIPNRRWDECLVEEGDYHMLHYHVVGDPSSKMVYEKIVREVLV